MSLKPVEHNQKYNCVLDEAEKSTDCIEIESDDEEIDVLPEPKRIQKVIIKKVNNCKTFTTINASNKVDYQINKTDLSKSERNEKNKIPNTFKNKMDQKQKVSASPVQTTTDRSITTSDSADKTSSNRLQNREKGGAITQPNNKNDNFNIIACIEIESDDDDDVVVEQNKKTENMAQKTVNIPAINWNCHCVVRRLSSTEIGKQFFARKTVQSEKKQSRKEREPVSESTTIKIFNVGSSDSVSSDGASSDKASSFHASSDCDSSESASSRFSVEYNPKRKIIRLYKCRHCPNYNAFTTKQGYYNHLRIHQRQRKFKASSKAQTSESESIKQSSSKVLNKQKLVSKKICPESEKRFECEYCNKKFSRSQHLKHHIKTHTGEKPFKCLKCNHTFGRKDALNKHFKIHEKQESESSTNIEPKSYHSRRLKMSCKYCNKVFRHSGHFKMHLRIHTGEKPYECTECDKKYPRKSHLDRHILGHETNGTLWRLAKEIESANDEKKYKCKFCNRKFDHGGHLNMHEKTHTGEKPFECTQCDRKFGRKDYLKNHLKIHEGNKRLELQETESESSNQSSNEVLRKRSTRNKSAKITTEEEQPTNESSIDISQDDFSDNSSSSFSCLDYGREPRGTRSRHQVNYREEFSDETDTGTHVRKTRLQSSIGSENIQQLSSTIDPTKTSDLLEKLENQKESNTNTLTDSQSKNQPVENNTKVYEDEANQNPCSSVKETESNLSFTKKFECPVCHNKFMYKGSLELHMKSECKDGLVQSNLLKNQEEYNNQEKIKNNKETVQKTRKSKHRVRRKRKSIIDDNSCDRYSSALPSTDYGREVNLKRNDLEVDYCELSSNESDIEPPLKKYTNKPSDKTNEDKNSFVCDWKNCGSRFSSYNRFTSHQESHLNTKKSHSLEKQDNHNTDLANVVVESENKTVNNISDRLSQNTGIELENIEIYDCKFCNKEYETEVSFKKHMETHSKTYECSICHCTYTKRSAFVTHMRAHGVIIPQVTILKVIKPYNGPKKSRKTHTDEKQYECSDCSTKFADMNSLQEHMKTHAKLKLTLQIQNVNGHDIVKIQKEKVPKKKRGRKKKVVNILNENSSIASSSTGYGTEAQTKRSEHRLNYNERLSDDENFVTTSYNNEKIFKCSKCPEKYHDFSELLDHNETSHLLEKINTNNADSKTESKKTSNEPGYRILNMNKKRRFVCPWRSCGKRYEHKALLENHILAHKNEKPFQCPSCDKRFRTKGTTKQHYLCLHDPQRTEFPCNKCDTSFKTNIGLHNHMLTHKQSKESKTSKERLYPCTWDNCNKKFTQSGVLSYHMRLHKQEKPFKCSSCNQFFRSKANLQSHWIINHDEQNKAEKSIQTTKPRGRIKKNHGCKHCGKMYKSNDLLEIHVKTHVNSCEKPFECSTCHKLFTQKVMFEKHMETHRKTILKEISDTGQGSTTPSIKDDSANVAKNQNQKLILNVTKTVKNEQNEPHVGVPSSTTRPHNQSAEDVICKEELILFD